MEPCPRCGKTLSLCRAGTDPEDPVAALCMEGCGGAWVFEALTEAAAEVQERGSLVVCVEAARTDMEGAEDADPTAPLHCVTCRREMVPALWGDRPDYVIDTCPEGHGFWIDGHRAMKRRGREGLGQLPEHRSRVVEGVLGRVEVDAERHNIARHDLHRDHPLLDLSESVFLPAE